MHIDLMSHARLGLPLESCMVRLRAVFHTATQGEGAADRLGLNDCQPVEGVGHGNGFIEDQEQGRGHARQQHPQRALAAAEPVQVPVVDVIYVAADGHQHLRCGSYTTLKNQTSRRNTSSQAAKGHQDPFSLQFPMDTSPWLTWLLAWRSSDVNQILQVFVWKAMQGHPDLRGSWHIAWIRLGA